MTAQRSSTTKQERVALRMTLERKQLLQRAAALKGSSLSEYVASTAEEAALKAVREHDVIILSARDSIAFVESLLQPPDPNDALRRAVQYQADLIS